MTIAGLLEFFLGNTFPCVVFVSLGIRIQLSITDDQTLTKALQARSSSL
jgi:succinate-acetate transporter protein